MTARTASTAAQAAHQARAWPLPEPMMGMVQPGDQIVFGDPTGDAVLHDTVALLTDAGKTAAALRRASGMADAAPANSPRTSAPYEITGKGETIRMTLVEPLPTGRVWFVTDTKILLTKRTSK